MLFIRYSSVNCTITSIGFRVFSVSDSAVPPPDSEMDGEESKKEAENNIETMVSGGIVVGRNCQLIDKGCFGTCRIWHERKPKEEHVTELGKEPETRP